MCTNISHPKNWKSAKSHEAVKHDIAVHFSFSTLQLLLDLPVCNQVGWKFVFDQGLPKFTSKKSSNSCHEKLESFKPKKLKHLSNHDIHGFLFSNKVILEEKLFAVAPEQNKESKKRR